MYDILDMKIGDVKFALRCRQPISIHEPDATYKPFLKNGAQTSTTEVVLDIDLNGLPDIPKMPVIFDGQSWSLLSDGTNYFFSSQPPASADPFWSAKINADFRTGTVYCSRQAITDKEGMVTVFNPLRYPLDQLLMMYVLALNEGAIIHAAGVNIGGKAFIFPGRSGAGKSTLSRQFRGRDDAEVLSDDRIVVRMSDGILTAYGTPWPGEESIALNKGVPLAGIFFMTHAEENRIAGISQQKAIEKLMPVVSIPWYDADMTSNILAFCDKLVSKIQVSELQFKPGIEAADFLIQSVLREKVRA